MPARMIIAMIAVVCAYHSAGANHCAVDSDESDCSRSRPSRASRAPVQVGRSTAFTQMDTELLRSKLLSAGLPESLDDARWAAELGRMLG